MTINEEHYSHIPLRQQASSLYTTRCQVKTWEAFLRISILTTQWKTTPTPLKQHPLKATGICITSYQSDNTSAIILTSHATINPYNPPHKSQNLLKRKWSLKNIFKFLLQWQVATLNQEPPQIFFTVHTSFHPHGWQANLKELGHKRTLYIWKQYFNKKHGALLGTITKDCKIMYLTFYQSNDSNPLNL